MKSFANLNEVPYELPLLADDLTEFHAARLLLLFRYCGANNRIDGLTKLAKLDFFVRYPSFFERASAHSSHAAKAATNSVESKMIRFHYGPWDRRYYRVLIYLEARDLIEITKVNDAYQFRLTDLGKQAAADLSSSSSFDDLIAQMQEVKKVFGKKSGTTLKNLIYSVFSAEVGDRSLGDLIEP
jgi:hypothetical protein